MQSEDKKNDQSSSKAPIGDGNLKDDVTKKTALPNLKLEPSELPNQVAEKIKRGINILIALSKDPNVDEISAAIALAILLDQQKKHVTAIYSGKTPNTLEFLSPNETFQKDTSGLQDFIIALNKSKADHLTYRLDGDYVKIFITPYKGQVKKEDLEYSYGDYNVDLVIVFNVNAGDEIDSALAEYGRIMHDASAINITSGVPGRFADLEWSDPSKSSVCEMVVDLAEALEIDNFSQDVATALLTGILSATERFSNSRTKPTTMSVASKLMAAGADQQLISSNILKEAVATDNVQNSDIQLSSEEKSLQPSDTQGSDSSSSEDTEDGMTGNSQDLAELEQLVSRSLKQQNSNLGQSSSPQQVSGYSMNSSPANALDELARESNSMLSAQHSSPNQSAKQAWQGQQLPSNSQMSPLQSSPFPQQYPSPSQIPQSPQTSQPSQPPQYLQQPQDAYSVSLTQQSQLSSQLQPLEQPQQPQSQSQPSGQSQKPQPHPQSLEQSQISQSQPQAQPQPLEKIQQSESQISGQPQQISQVQQSQSNNNLISEPTDSGVGIYAHTFNAPVDENPTNLEKMMDEVLSEPSPIQNPVGYQSLINQNDYISESLNISNQRQNVPLAVGQKPLINYAPGQNVATLSVPNIDNTPQDAYPNPEYINDVPNYQTPTVPEIPLEEPVVSTTGTPIPDFLRPEAFAMNSSTQNSPSLQNTGPLPMPDFSSISPTEFQPSSQSQFQSSSQLQPQSEFQPQAQLVQSQLQSQSQSQIQPQIQGQPEQLQSQAQIQNQSWQPQGQPQAQPQSQFQPQPQSTQSPTAFQIPQASQPPQATQSPQVLQFSQQITQPTQPSQPPQPPQQTMQSVQQSPQFPQAPQTSQTSQAPQAQNPSSPSSFQIPIIGNMHE